MPSIVASPYQTPVAVPGLSPAVAVPAVPVRPAAVVVTQGPQGIPGPMFDGFGWANQQDSQYTQASPLTIPAGQETQLTLDGLGPQSDSSHLRPPFQGWRFWVNNRFYPFELYDKYDLRISFYAQSLAINNSLKLRLDIGPPIGTFYEDRESFTTEAGESRLFSFVIPFYDKATFVANGGAILVTPISAPMLLWGASIYLDVSGAGA